MSDQFSFLNNEALWWLSSLIPLTAVLIYLERIRTTRLLALGASSPKKQISQNKLRIFIPLIITALIIFALARPYYGFREIKLPRSGRDIMLVLDISRSMLTKDVSPSRLEFSKRKIQDLIDLVANTSAGDRLGIVLFAGESYLYCPLTEDYAVLRYFVKSVSTDLINSSGSAILEAVKTAIESLKEVKAKNARILFISDGEDDSLNLEATIQEVKATGFKIDVLGVGTLEGQPISLSDGTFVKDRSGNIVISKLNQESLYKLAEGTTGKYRLAGYSDSDLLYLVSDNATVSENSDLSKQKSVIVYNELNHWFTLASLIIALSFGLYRRSALFSIIIYSTLFGHNQASADQPLPTPVTTPDKGDILSLNQAFSAYEEGKFEEAKKSFQSHLDRDPENIKITQSLASTYYKLKQFDKAKETFEKMNSMAKTGKEKFEALYNLGNSYYMLEDFESAIKNFSEALTLKPDDEKVLHNLALAKKALQEQRSKATPTPTPTPTSNSEDQKQSTPSPQPSQSPSPNGTPSPSASSKPDENQQSENQQNDKDGKQQPSEESPEKEQDSDPKKDQQSGDSEKQENQESEQNENESQVPSEAKQEPIDEKAMKEEEARAWLDSLSDAPILLRRKFGKSSNNGGQTW